MLMTCEFETAIMICGLAKTPQHTLPTGYQMLPFRAVGHFIGLKAALVYPLM